MTIRLQEVKILSDNQLIKKLHCAACIYYEYIDKDILVVFSKSKEGPFFFYEFFAGKENFQHLAGVRCPTGANNFYDKCFNGSVTRQDIVPAKNIKTTSSKIDVLPDAINLKNAKVYKMGEKDLVTEYNQFSMAIGNKSSVMGMDDRGGFLPIPITVMDRSIQDFSSDTYNIFLIMTKATKEKKYNEVLFEKTKSILTKASFGEDIFDIIEKSLYIEQDEKVFEEVAATLEVLEK